MELLQSGVVARVTGATELPSDLDQMRSSLPRVNHLMERAEWWRFKSAYIDNLLKELRDAAYDAEDLLAEFDYYELKQKIEGTKTTNQLVSSLGSFIRNLVSNSSSKVKDLQNKLDLICGKLESELGPLGLPDGPILYDKDLQRETTSFLPDHKVFGREEHVEKVLKLMMRSVDDPRSSNEASSSLIKRVKRRKTCNFSILPIVGMGGMGKTTLAQLIYNDERVKNHFDLRIWVCVSHYFDLKRITKEMIESANIELAAKGGLRNYENQNGFGENLANLDSLQQILKGKVASRRYLLVLDDVWHNKTRDWESLCNPLLFGDQGSMILITTRELTVANVAGTLDPIELGCLPDDIFWELFKKCAFGSDDTTAFSELESIGKKIASKLKGCPLAAKTLGGILCVNMTIEHWRNILESELWQLKQDDESLLVALRVSYQYLPMHLKRCFLVCSLFPKTFSLTENKLGPIWMADGIISHEKDAFYYEKGYEYFRELTSRSFILHSWKYFLHDHMHDLAKFLSLDMCYWQEEKDWSLKNHNSARHLSINRKPIELIENEISKCKKLRSLSFLDCYHYGINEIKLGPTTLASLFNQLTHLRLLDLRGCNIEELPENIGKLKLLFYINLEKTKIRNLPDSLCQLYNLEVINVDECPIEKFPNRFSNLINLRLINFTFDSTHPMSSKIARIGMLTCLEELKYFKVLKQEGHKIDELKNMTRLSDYIHISNLENVEGRHEASQACLNNKKHLTHLALSWSPGRDTSSGNGGHVIDEDTIEGLQPHSNLKYLYIKNYGGRTMPSWLQTEKLPYLCSLYITECSNLKSLENCFMPHQLSALQLLCIEDCSNLLSLPLEWISSSSLIRVEIRNCPFLICPSNLILPSSLTYLQLDSCGEFEKSLSSCLENSHSLEFLNLTNCHNITSLPSQVTNCLSRLLLSNCAELHCLEVSRSSTLFELDIEKCPKLVHSDFYPTGGDSEASLESNQQFNMLRIDNTSLLKLPFLRTPFCSLAELEIRNSPEERMFVGDSHGSLNGLQNLRELSFIDCLNLESLPEMLHTLVTLENITIFECPKLQSLPENGFPSSLQCLYFRECHPSLAEQLRQHDKASEI